MGYTITDLLEQWANYGVFSYVLPFLIIFALLFGILQKTKLLGKPDKTKGINAVIAFGVSLASLQFDFVSTFFSTIFPRFGVLLAVFLVLIIAIGFFVKEEDLGKLQWIGWVVGIGAVVWAWSNWNFWGDNYGLGGWMQEYFWVVIVFIAIGGGVAMILNSDKEKKGSS